MDNDQHSAIQAALSQDWNKAIEINILILENSKNCLEALSRLAYAYTQIGEINKAKDIYKKILSLDRYNLIAKKNLIKINNLPKCFSNKSIKNKDISNFLSPGQFIEEPGRTKTIFLINIAPVDVISKLHIGDLVKLNAKKYTVEVRDENNNYLGALPDDISFRMVRFLKAGNQYKVCIKNIQKNSLVVFIREIKRGKKFLSQPTFLSASASYSSSIPREIKKEDKDIENKENNENQEESDE